MRKNLYVCSDSQHTFHMKHWFSLLTGKLGYSDLEIISMLQSGMEKQVRSAENFLYERYRGWIFQKPFTEILKDKLDREEAYADANLNLVNNIKSGKFEVRSGLKTYFYEIFKRTCVTQLRRNATKKNIPVPFDSNPSDELLKNLADDVQSELRDIMSKESSDLWELALKQFQHSNYRCYYVLALYDGMEISYQKILEFTDNQRYQSNDGQVLQREELMAGLKDEPLQLNTPTPGALKALASRCRIELRTLFERLKHPNQTRKP